MISIKVKILFAMSLSVLFTYTGILYFNYDNITEIIPTHVNFKGEIDGYGNKIQLWIISLFNFFLILIIYLAAKFPKYWNIPFKPNNLVVFQKNKDAYGNIINYFVLCSIYNDTFYIKIFNY